jgi:hypothetical protein
LIPDGAVLTRGGVGPGNFIPGGGGGGGGGSCINDYTENDVRFTSTGSGGGGGAGAPYTPPDAQDVVYGAPTTDPPEVVITWVPAAPGGVTGRPYTYRYPGGGHFTDWSGTLPPGLTLAPDGLLTGTPTKSGSYSFTVNRRSDAGEDTRWPVSIAIDLVPHSATGGTIGSFITGLGDLLGRLTEPPIEQGHGISVTFSAETTGVLSDRLALQGAGLARAARARRPLVIAAGRTRVSKLGRTSLKVPLTPRGHRLLRAAIQHHRVLRLTSLVTFRPVGAATITRTGRYRLRP